LASRRICGVSSADSRTVAATSSSSASWSRNHGSIEVASCSSATLAPARSAATTVPSRPSRGVPACASSAARSGSPASSPGGPQTSAPSAFSSDRSAFCSASVKQRPIAMASPTDFMWVVRVWSAAGNFSNANRGTLTTT
jgi:hypothetical protein